MKLSSLFILIFGITLSANNTPAQKVTNELTKTTKNKTQAREEKLAKRALEREEKTKLREERIKKLHSRLDAQSSKKGVADDACAEE